MLHLGDIRPSSEICAPVDLASGNKFNRAVALGRIITLGEENTRRRGSGVLGPAGRSRKLVLVGVSAADER